MDQATGSFIVHLVLLLMVPATSTLLTPIIVASRSSPLTGHLSQNGGHMGQATESLIVQIVLPLTVLATSTLLTPVITASRNSDLMVRLSRSGDQ